ncbi:iron-sulfur cluster repair di-iron protein [Luteitalea sp.]|jgi:regulator of cell morphogenesis and NO signaling
MTITPDSTVADIATQAPETIRVFQQHQIDFCCGGRIPLSQACSTHKVDLDALLTELQQVVAPATDEPTWNVAALTEIVAHIQARYHEPLRVELPRIAAMVAKVVSRHGDHLPETLPPVQETFSALHDELIAHMEKEDRVLFPFIVGLESGTPLPVTDAAAWIAGPISIMEADHDEAGSALATLRRLTDGYAPPEWACPTFRGLYHALETLETDMHLHVHLENNILFPRAMQLAGRAH